MVVLPRKELAVWTLWWSTDGSRLVCIPTDRRSAASSCPYAHLSSATCRGDCPGVGAVPAGVAGFGLPLRSGRAFRVRGQHVAVRQQRPAHERRRDPAAVPFVGRATG